MIITMQLKSIWTVIKILIIYSSKINLCVLSCKNKLVAGPASRLEVLRKVSSTKQLTVVNVIR